MFTEIEDYILSWATDYESLWRLLIANPNKKIPCTVVSKQDGHRCIATINHFNDNSTAISIGSPGVMYGWVLYEVNDDTKEEFIQQCKDLRLEYLPAVFKPDIK